MNGSTTGFLYDGPQVIAELRGGSVDTVYHTGMAIDEVLARYGSSGNKTLLTDALMSVIAQTNDAQNADNFYAYSPYGETVTLGPDSANSIQFTGREHDGIGSVYFRTRTLDPILKRFISEDRLGIAAGLNLYQYANSNPISFNDPTGEIPPPLLTGAIGAVGGAIGSLGAQIAMGQIRCIDWQGVGLATLTGFAAGAILPYTAAGGIAASALIGGVSNVGQYYAQNALAGTDPTDSGAAKALWTGIVGGAIGGTFAAPVFNQSIARLLQPSAQQQLLKKNAGVGNFSRSALGSAASNFPSSCGCP